MKKFTSITLCIAILLTLFSFSVSASKNISEGKCGDDLTWALDKDGNLCISGTGSMYSFSENDPEWISYSAEIKGIVIGYALSNVSEDAFADCSNISDVYFIGTENEKQNLTIEDGNGIIINAAWHFLPCGNAEINVCPARNYDYRTKVTVKATATGIREGYYLAIYINGSQVAKQENKGEALTEVSYYLGELKSDVSYTVKIVDSNGNVQQSVSGKELSKDAGTVKSVKSLIKIISAFFKGLFNSLPSATAEPLS